MALIICKSKEQILTHFKIRQEVFILEQKVPCEDELDFKEFDGEMFLYTDENENYVACARVLFEGDKAHLGRVATLKEYRNKGYGAKMVKAIERLVRSLGKKEIYLGSQLSARGFYEKCGYSAYGDIFLDAGIKHIHMKKDL